MRFIASLVPSCCAFSFGAALLLTGAKAAAEGLRCGDRLISNGDTLYKVRALCGEPDAADRRIVTRTERRRVQGPCFRDARGQVRCEQTSDVAIDVVVDEWTYDFGSERFIRYLTFENGRLVYVTTGGYGYKN
jgi:hypothetical protein